MSGRGRFGSVTARNGPFPFILFLLGHQRGRIPYLVIVRDDGGDLPARQGDVLSRQVVHGPGAGVQGVVEGVLAAVAPVPALQRGRTLYGEHLLVNCLTVTPQAHCELRRKEEVSINSPGHFY